MSPTVNELHELTNIRNEAISENAAAVANAILKAVYLTLDEFVDGMAFSNEVVDNNLVGVVRLGLKSAVLCRLNDDTNDKLFTARREAREAWEARTA